VTTERVLLEYLGVKHLVAVVGASMGGRQTWQWGDLVKALHDSAELSAIYLRGVQSFSDLDAVSKLRFSAFNNRFFKNFQAMYFSHRDGTLSASIMGRDRADVERYDCLPGHTPVLGNAETLALGRVWPRRGRNHCKGQ
jgi:hypothetical protein